MIKRAKLVLAPGHVEVVIPASPAGARRVALRRLIAEQGFVSVTDVARAVGISEMTVRRDLEALERAGLIERSHGGAVSTQASSVIAIEPTYAARRELNREAKHRIALRAASLVSVEEAIGLDTGSTISYLAAELAGRERIRIVTNSLQTILAMPQPILPEVFLLGGRLRPREGSLCGGIAHQQLSGHWLDRFFLGVGGIDENGVHDYSPEDTETKSVFIQQSKAVTAV
jgi:DeoR/GlpR family transcriptional regulator of sugar metabolism